MVCSRRAFEWMLILLTAGALALSFLSFRSGPFIFDEAMHFPRILGVATGHLRDVQWGVMLPGYHFLIGGIMGLFHLTSVAAARLISFVISTVLCCGAAFLVARSLDRESALLRTAQTAVFPLLFAIFPLLYTDALSLGLVLLGLWFALRPQSLSSALLLTLAVLVRQNNILWAPLFFGIIALKERGTWRALFSWSVLPIALPFILPCALFIAFVIMNGGLAVNFAASHPLGFFPGNIFCALALLGAIFLPVVIAKAGDMAALVHRHRIVLLLLALFLLVFLFTFTVSHPFNQDMRYWRNVVLVTVTHEWWAWVLFALSMVLALLALITVRLQAAGAWLLYPISVLYLGGSWLIDMRYAIIPLVLFLLLREKRSWKEEMVQYAYQVVVCMWVFS